MPSAKDIRLKPIDGRTASALVRRLHYSGKTTQNPQIHIGVYLGASLLGALQFGPPIDKRRMRGLVEGTAWDGFLELNRMAFDDRLPRNSESRALAISMRLLKKHRPGVEWVVSFADATQCGDGTIYRASGFVLTSVKPNRTMLRMPDGSVIADKTLNDRRGPDGRTLTSHAKQAGAKPLAGYQLRYVYFLNPEARARLTVPELPYSAIDEAGARMYRGRKPN